MQYLENVSDKTYNAYFIDLNVRPSNKVAIALYERLGYIDYHRSKNYYTNPEEDRVIMRKPLPRDSEKLSISKKPEDMEKTGVKNYKNYVK